MVHKWWLWCSKSLAKVGKEAANNAKKDCTKLSMCGHYQNYKPYLLLTSSRNCLRSGNPAENISQSERAYCDKLTTKWLLCKITTNRWLQKKSPNKYISTE